MPSINHGYQKQEDGSMTLIDLAVKAENAIMSDGSTAEENINNTIYNFSFYNNIYYKRYLWIV